MVSGAAFAVAMETFRIFGSAGAETQLTPPFDPENVADITTFAEAVGASRRWKVRLKMRADSSDRTADRLRAGEALVQVSVRPWLDVTAGRVIEKWGTAYAWNPTAFVSPPKDPTDPGDRRSAYRGMNMVKADVFVRDTNVSLYALEHGAFAGRAYRLIRDTDVSVNFHRDASGTSVGTSLSRVFGDALEVHGEVARVKGEFRAVAGAQYTFRNNVNAVIEMYEDHVFVRAAWQWLELITITDVSGASTIVRATASYELRPNLSVYAIETEFFGRTGIPIERATNVGMRYSF